MLYFENDINKKYTEIINSYINKGYVINYKTINGMESEICKIDLTKDCKTIIRIRIEKTNSDDFNNNEIKNSYDIKSNSIKIVIEKFNNNASNDLWNDKGENIHTIIYYAINNNRNGKDIYTDSMFDALDCENIHWKRIREKYNDGHVINCNYNKIVKMLKNHKGYSAITKKDIISVKRYNNYYEISVKNKKWI